MCSAFDHVDLVVTLVNICIIILVACASVNFCLLKRHFFQALLYCLCQIMKHNSSMFMSNEVNWPI